MTTMTTKPSAPPKLRHEWKHQINLREDLVLSARLRRLFPHDPHAGPDGSYRVTSLYFDTPYDTALREKLDGVNRREKFRLRYYGTDTSFLRLEKKYKINGLCGKRSARLTLEQAQRLLSGDWAFLLESGNPLLQEFYTKLRRGLAPKTVVCYDREAFLYSSGNVRLTLGRNLHSGLRSLDFLAPGVVMHRYPKARLWWRSNMMTSCRIWFAWRFRSAAERPGLIPNMPSAGAMIRSKTG